LEAEELRAGSYAVPSHASNLRVADLRIQGERDPWRDMDSPYLAIACPNPYIDWERYIYRRYSSRGCCAVVEGGWVLDVVWLYKKIELCKDKKLREGWKVGRLEG
jgi:hypothetical protein